MFAYVLCFAMFKSGFLSGLTSGFDVGTKGFGGIIGRTGIMAIVGGTASVIGGGKFSNGAFGSAMTHLFNAEYDNLGKALKGLWSKKGEIMNDAKIALSSHVKDIPKALSGA